MRTRLLALVAAAAAIGCADSTAPKPTIVGAYQLSQVNGKSASADNPARFTVLFPGGTLTTVTIAGGNACFSSTGSFALTRNRALEPTTAGASGWITDNGTTAFARDTFNLSGTELASGAPFTAIATIAGSDLTLTIAAEASTYVFVRYAATC